MDLSARNTPNKQNDIDMNRPNESLVSFLKLICPDDIIRKRMLLYLALRLAPRINNFILDAVIYGTGSAKDVLVKLIESALGPEFDIVVQDNEPEPTPEVYGSRMVFPVVSLEIEVSEDTLTRWKSEFQELLISIDL